MAKHRVDPFGGFRPSDEDGFQDVVIDELCSALFWSLPRSDQRHKGAEYVRGLLLAEGRKSIRNIAAAAGGRCTEQNLHHFICSSTWDWTPIRAALARYAVRVATPLAWVVRTTVIPKAGEHSVGVERTFIPSMGQVFNAQRAFGVWASADNLSIPVNWRLQLSKAWLDDPARRTQASIPVDHVPETVSDCVVETFAELVAAEPTLPVRPVVLDARELDVLRVVRGLRAAGAPPLVRVEGTLPLRPVAHQVKPRLPAPSGFARPAAGRPVGVVPAGQLVAEIRNLRRPVTWSDPAAGGAARTSLVAATTVRLPGQAVRGRAAAGAAGPGSSGAGLAGLAPVAAHGDEMMLLAAGPRDRRWPTELWLTDLTDLDPVVVFRLSRLTDQVDRYFAPIADEVGLRDFAGRSYGGWHRHVTLSSVAQAVAALTDAAQRRSCYAC